ncbi:TPA: ribosome-binding factor A [Candidatus Nomurabacteria bacterium]|nr:MAG: Ribosome-binding factor A [Parcubacteria bacterium RAAC4_OD1_1]HCY26385.1 ribosome-binding factor A [Candidatus Nomurabacteria bacterium]
MSNFRDIKIENRVKELSASFIEREASPSSLITVTRVLMSKDSKKAKIMISVLPKEKENAAYGFIKRNLGEMRKYISSSLKINPIPFLDVEIDEGEKNRQKIDELLNNS